MLMCVKKYVLCPRKIFSVFLPIYWAKGKTLTSEGVILRSKYILVALLPLRENEGK